MKRQSYRRVRIIIAAGVLLAAVFCLLAENEYAPALASLQPGPILVKLATGFSMSTLGLAACLLGTTFLFGRYLCAALCPLGTTQDAIGAVCERIKPRKGNAANIPNAKGLRYGIALLTLLFLAGGWSIGFRFFDPFSRFGGIASVFLKAATGELPPESAAEIPGLALGGLLPLMVLTAFVYCKRRFYCTAICPVGTMLGLGAKYGVYRLRMNGACTSCGLCATDCPTGCIDVRRRVIDNERCVRCLNCVSLCPRGGIDFSRRPGGSDSTGADINASRRAFLIKGVSAAAGAVLAGHALGGPIRIFAGSAYGAEGMIFPPGAMDREEFARKCASCQLCAIVCPAGIIKPSAYALGPVHLDYSRSGCQYDCARCGAVCPFGALRRLALDDKQWLRIGVAEFDAPRCRAIREKAPCDLCAQACPKGAILMVDGPSGIKIPEVLAFHCIGCGACQAVCPARPKAITVRGIEQRLT
jgi:ferredoxin